MRLRHRARGERLFADGRQALAPRSVDSQRIAQLGVIAQLNHESRASSEVDRLARQPIDLTARTALVVELRDDAELRDALTVDAPWRKRLATVCEQALASCAVAQAHKRVSDLVSLIDAMLMYRACRVAQLSTRTTLRAYFAGLG